MKKFSTYFVLSYIHVTAVLAGQAFSKDGVATKVCESIPVVGYAASAVHAIAGNEEHAKRAAAKCTSSTITAAGAICGGGVGGVPAAMLGASLMGVAGNAVEAEIAKNHIHDELVKADCTNHDAVNYVGAFAFAAAGAGIAGVGNVAAKQVLRELGKQGLIKGVAGFAAGKVAEACFVNVPKALIPKNISTLTGRLATRSNKSLHINSSNKRLACRNNGDGDEFIVYLFNNNLVAIYHKKSEKFVTATPEGTLIANASQVNEHEVFQVNKQGSKLCFKTCHNTYFCIDGTDVLHEKEEHKAQEFTIQ
ncbi:hypothetical protein O9G_000042 [Rozella allomycis CSF55]|uniref:Uncharacterized protein n=1 Tax=Rozella allomycis (strain CSF55) TaxID=988480 RepID=A0A075AS96_ROZAC|nr:hypothetical protein O9G_000042 [Rozella allomycis CSF55]|eukprot:EPZ31566.1 hypothetical protein O9G_000042 [Rozella allomycis CSF55]